jgi:hypothetical protein
MQRFLYIGRVAFVFGMTLAVALAFANALVVGVLETRLCAYFHSHLKYITSSRYPFEKLQGIY